MQVEQCLVDLCGGIAPRVRPGGSRERGSSLGTCAIVQLHDVGAFSHAPFFWQPRDLCRASVTNRENVKRSNVAALEPRNPWSLKRTHSDGGRGSTSAGGVVERVASAVAHEPDQHDEHGQEHGEASVAFDGIPRELQLSHSKGKAIVVSVSA